MTMSTKTRPKKTGVRTRQEIAEQERARQERRSARAERMGEMSHEEIEEKNREYEQRQYERQADLDRRREEFYRKVATERNAGNAPMRGGEPAPATTRR
jgi:hypothetical protein